MKKQNNPRFASFDALREAEEKNGYLNIILPSVMGRYELSEKDKALCGAIAKGVYETDRALCHAIKYLSTFPLEKIDKKILLLLKIGLYQILFMDKIPPFAACNETVDIASSLCGKKATGFLNGVLRNAVRKKETLQGEIAKAPAAVRLSVSDDVYAMFATQYGVEAAEKIISRYFAVQPLCLRLNTLVTDRETLSQKLSLLGVEAISCEKDGIAVYGHGESVIAAMKQSGEFYVQGFSSQSAVEALDAKENDTVIDMCACPGGKSLGAAIDMKNKGKVLSFDLHKSKLGLITESAKRLGVDIIETFCADSTKHISSLENSADKVICDVPCSGTGSIGKRPEIRYKKADELDSLTDTQYKILQNAVSYLKKGGTIVYSVCSLNKKEGEEIIERYLKENSDALLISQKTIIPEKDGYDGFYIAKLQKK